MKGQLISAKLCHENKEIFWKLTLADDAGNIIGTFGSKSNTLDFRTFTFGLIKILNKQNLFELTDEAISAPVFVKSSPMRIESIGNEEGYFLTIDSNAQMSYGKGFDKSLYERAKLATLESKSGILSARIEGKYWAQYLQAPHAYRGFKPVYNVDSSFEQQIYGANYFSMFVYQILNICKIDDLITYGKGDYPELSIVLDDTGKISAVGNITQNTWLVLTDKGYALSNTPMEQITVDPQKNTKI